MAAGDGDSWPNGSAPKEVDGLTSRTGRCSVFGIDASAPDGPPLAASGHAFAYCITFGWQGPGGAVRIGSGGAALTGHCSYSGAREPPALQEMRLVV